VPDVPKRVAERIAEQIKIFQPTVADAIAKDIGEADTVAIVRRMLGDLFGYDETHQEITAEFPVKENKCDLATKLDDQFNMLIEVKRVGVKLRDPHINQAVNYAAHSPSIDWVILTNAHCWRAYCVKNEKPINQDLVVEFDFLELDRKSDEHLELLFLLCKEGWAKSAIEEYQSQRQAVTRFMVGAAILSDEGLTGIRKALQRTAEKAGKSVHVSIDDVRTVIENDVMKRDVLEGDRFGDAAKKIKKAAEVSLHETT